MKAGQEAANNENEKEEPTYEVPKDNDLINQAAKMLEQKKKEGESTTVKVFDYSQKIPYADLKSKKYDSEIDVTSKEVIQFHYRIEILD